MTTSSRTSRRSSSGTGTRAKTTGRGTGAIAPEPVNADPTAELSGPRKSAGAAHHPRAAAERATRDNSTQVSLPLVGTVRLPGRSELAFLGGVGVLALVGAIDWPVAVVLGAGHALAVNRHNRTIQEFGEALEEA